MILKEKRATTTSTATKKLLILLLCLVVVGCQKVSAPFEPNVVYIPTDIYLEKIPSAFPKITPEEARYEWSKEYRLGGGFVEELDFYRAITCFKRAGFLMPKKNEDRKLQVDFCVMQAYYMGFKYCDALRTFDKSNLINVPTDFPAMRELQIMLYDCYLKNNEFAKAELILKWVGENDCELADDLYMYEVISKGDIDAVESFLSEYHRSDSTTLFLAEYYDEMKSVRKAQVLNAVLPGAGYLYVGQKKSALTSFLINTVFIAAAYQFFHKGYTAAGIITTSLEFGWYIGGINGAGLAAKEFNERLYESKARNFLICEKLFPVLMFDYAF